MYAIGSKLTLLYEKEKKINSLETYFPQIGFRMFIIFISLIINYIFRRQTVIFYYRSC